MIAEIPDGAPAWLKSFLNGNADSGKGGPRLRHDGDHPLQRTAVCQEVVNDQDMVVRT